MSSTEKPAEHVGITPDSSRSGDPPHDNHRQVTNPQSSRPHGNRPVRVFRAYGVSVAVFENPTSAEGRQGVLLKAEVRRVYRAGGEFRFTHALSIHDVPVARLLLDQAFAFMLEAGQGRAGADPGPDE